MAERELLVRIIGDDRDLQRALGNTERRVASVDNRMASFGKNATRAFAAAGIAVGLSESVRLAGQMVDAASDLEEQMARTEQVFDDSATSVQSWSAGLASSFGIAQASALEFAGTFGLLFRNTGSTAQEAEQFSKQLVELAADLASFNNTDVDTALNALRSGLTGEIEPLQKFGVFLSEARTKQEALANSSGKTSDELTTQDKVLARMNIIMADTVRAQGDFSRTSDGLANKQRIAAAEAKNLSSNLGQALAPAMDIALISTIALAGGLNDLISGMGDLRQALRDSDMFDGFNEGVQEAQDGFADFLNDIVKGIPLLDDLERATRDAFGDAPSRTVQARTGPGGPGDLIPDDSAKEEAERAIREAKQAELALKRSRQRFAEFVQGLGLKLDKAGLTATLEDDLDALREIERAIQRQIAKEGKTFALVQDLTDVRLQIASVIKAQSADSARAAQDMADAAEDARQESKDAFDRTLDALELGFDMAQATKSFADDESALRAIESAILARIASEGQTTDLMRQLFNVRQEQAAVAKQLAEQKRERRQGRQFEALGLTEEGDRPTPGAGALRRRLGNLREQIKGTTLDTEKTRRELDRIAAVLSGKFGAVGKEVRAAILQMFNDISGALDEGGTKTGPLTKTSGLNTKKILAGLGLSPEEINELRGRLSSINSAGQQLSGLGPAPGGRFQGRPGMGGNNQFFLESTTTINLDGQQIAKVTTKQQQKQRRRNPQQKRGPNRHR